MASFEIVSEVTTESTGLDGVRHSAWSEWSVTTAPDDFVINRDLIKIEWLSSNGSENTYDLVYDNYVEIIHGSGLKFPTTIKVRAYALSPKGHASGRGWSKVKFTGDFVKYK